MLQFLILCDGLLGNRMDYSKTMFFDASEVVLYPILHCIDVFSTYLGKILDFVVVHWSFIFISHVRLIDEFI